MIIPEDMETKHARTMRAAPDEIAEEMYVALGRHALIHAAKPETSRDFFAGWRARDAALAAAPPTHSDIARIAAILIRTMPLNWLRVDELADLRRMTGRG